MSSVSGTDSFIVATLMQRVMDAVQPSENRKLVISLDSGYFH